MSEWKELIGKNAIVQLSRSSNAFLEEVKVIRVSPSEKYVLLRFKRENPIHTREMWKDSTAYKVVEVLDSKENEKEDIDKHIIINVPVYGIQGYKIPFAIPIIKGD